MTWPPTYRQVSFWAVTFLSMWAAGSFHAVLYASSLNQRWALWSEDAIRMGLWYALGLWAILSAHEGGHLIACWRAGLKSSGPYFLPSPFPLVGTFGAFIRVHDRYPSRSALLEVGLSGPVAGFLACLPILWIGLLWSHTHSLEQYSPVARFGTPWIVEGLGWLVLGPGTLYLHPLAVAGWIGCLFTMLNLIPYGQFDGGHIVRACFGAVIGRAVSLMAASATIYLATKSLTWFVIGLIMLLGWDRNEEPVDLAVPRRRWWALGTAVVIFGLCWNQIDL